jgi:hypothetical protein
MTGPVRDVPALLRGCDPVLHEGVFAFTAVPHGADLHGLDVVATMREARATTVVLPEERALAAGLPILFRAAWITLAVPSDLEAVGFTAAVAAALAGVGVACNVIAGAHHDHLFVPFALASVAMARLRALQSEARAGPA